MIEEGIVEKRVGEGKDRVKGGRKEGEDALI